MKARPVAIVALMLVIRVMPTLAHHSLSVEFDTDKTVMLTGTITEMKWSNPHGWLYIDVKDAKGEIQKWAVEFASPNQLYRRGWRREDLPVSASVVVNGYPSRDNSARISATDVKLPDGRTLFAGNNDRQP
jgi:hypothetical protein